MIEIYFYIWYLLLKKSCIFRGEIIVEIKGKKEIVN